MEGTFDAAAGAAAWNDMYRAAWTPPPKLTPSEWALRYRVLSRRQAARAGRWRHEHAPYLRGIMDLCVRPAVEEITICKAAQVGASEAIRNVLGYFAHQDPDPILLVLPDEQTGRRIMRKRILPLVEDTPCLAELKTEQTRDVQLRQVLLSNGFTLSLGWSGSPATLASDPQRIVVNDEVDKFQPWSGRESDPVSLGYVRTQTYEGRRKIINISTPTTRLGLIFQRWDGADVKLYYFVPCPHCGQWQRLRFDRLRWKKFEGVDDPKKQAALVGTLRAAWYECEHCAGRITEHDKPRMVNAGVWAVEAARDRLPRLAAAAGPGGVVTADWPPGARVGLHVSSLYCLWVRFWEVAAKFLRSQGDPAAMMDFRNGWLGEVFEQQIARAGVSTFAKKCRNAPPAGVAPAWAGKLLMTADVQKDHCYYVVRAWGHGFKSRRIRHGVCMTLDELKAIADGYFPMADSSPGMACALLGIDSGHRTEEVYRFALEDRNRIKALKGEAEPQGRPIRLSRVSYAPPDRKSAPMQVWLHLLDTQYFKDQLAAKITARADLDGHAEDDPWQLNQIDDEEYNRQMASEHKVLARKGRTMVERWVKLTDGAANHFWDCEVYQLAVAYMARVDLLPPPPEDAADGGPPPAPRKPSGIRMPDGRPFLITQR